MKAIVASARARVALVTCDAMAYTLEAGQFLDIQVDQLARMLALIAARWFLWLQGRQATLAAPGETGRHGRAGQLQVAGDLICCEPVLPSQRLDQADLVFGRAIGNGLEAGRAVGQSARPFRSVAGQPLAGGALADAKAADRPQTGGGSFPLDPRKSCVHSGAGCSFLRFIRGRVATTTFTPSDGINYVLRSQT
ncbi:hypothetical protein J4G37_12895 [Microvirga sp. 3-52]|nr:hypothetical protein [Microvirga sp. 3-52]